MLHRSIKIKSHRLQLGSGPSFIFKSLDFSDGRPGNFNHIHILHNADKLIIVRTSPCTTLATLNPNSQKLTANIVLRGQRVLSAGSFTSVEITAVFFRIRVTLCSPSKSNTVRAIRVTILASASVVWPSKVVDAGGLTSLCKRPCGLEVRLLWLNLSP